MNLQDLIGKKVTFLCMNYFYTGTLVDMNDSIAQLSEPYIVYDTGAWSEPKWADAQKLPTDLFYIKTSSIESFGVLK